MCVQFYWISSPVYIENCSPKELGRLPEAVIASNLKYETQVTFIVLKEHLTLGTYSIIDMFGINEDVSSYKQWKFQHKYCGFWPPASL